MAVSSILLQAVPPFDFWSTLQAHGWVDLLPNEYQAATNSFLRIEELSSGKVVRLDISAGEDDDSVPIMIEIQHTGKLSGADRSQIENAVRHMLRLDEDFAEFYALCRQHGRPWSEMLPGKGRLLRSPDLFEDMVKVICTTNIQWGGTRRMVRELVESFGSPYPFNSQLKAFPKAETIAAVPFSEFQARLHLGYRAAYIHTLAVHYAEGRQMFNDFFKSESSSAEIKKKLLAIKGIGNYAAASILMLLGCYDEIPVDSVFQQLMYQKYFHQEDFDLKDALVIYADWGKWKYLAYWFDLLTFHQMAENERASD